MLSSSALYCAIFLYGVAGIYGFINFNSNYYNRQYFSRCIHLNAKSSLKPKKSSNSIGDNRGVMEIPLKDSRMKFGLGSIAFSLLQLSPEAVGRRKTIFKEIVKNQIWTLDQIQGIINVNVPVRSTIIKLKDGGLFINNPIAPTDEAIDYIKELESKYGEVKYITLSSLALEHKGTAGAFAAKFRNAEIYTQPGQYSFPINLPTQFFFPLGRNVNTIPEDASNAPWGEEIDHAILGPLRPPGVGGFSETAFYHKNTKTLLVTDTIIDVTDDPPDIINEDPRALLYHARDNMFERVQDTKENRRKGWRRMVLFGLTFQPAGIDIKDTFETLKVLKDVPDDMRALGEGAIPFDGGFYPWEWIEDERPSFKALQGGLCVAPILQKLILNREPEKVLKWADTVADWSIQRIIPCHFANDIKATSKDFRKAFEFLEEPSFLQNLGLDSLAPSALPADGQLLSDASENLTNQGVLFPEAPLVKRK